MTQLAGLALDLAAIVMRNGGSTAMADRTFRDVLKGYGQLDVHAVWRLDFVGAYGLAEDGAAMIARPVGATAINLVRASEAAVLGQRVARGEVGAAALAAEIERINALRPPYGRWTTVAAAACAGAGFSRIIGGDWGALGLALVAAGAGQALRPMLQGRSLGSVVVTLVCGVLSASIAAVGLRLGLSQTEPAALVASVIYMVPGIPLIIGFMDVLTQRHLLVGLGRIANALLVFVILAIAIAFALTFAT